MHAFLYFFCSLLGLSQAQYAAIAGHKAARNLAIRGIAISVGSIAFGMAVFSFTRALLEYDILPAMAFALVCAGILFLIELNNVQDILATGKIGWKLVLTRIAVIGMMFLSSVIMAIFPMERDIRAHLAKSAQLSTQQLENDSRFKAQLEAARRATEQSSKDVVREKALLQRLNELNTSYAAAKSKAENECKGYVDADDGRKRDKGCGTIAGGFETKATRLDTERTSVSHELSALAGSSERLNSAQSRLDDINGQIKAEADVLKGGAASRLGALWSLMLNDGRALMVVGFYLVLSLLPEIMVLTALSKPGVYQPVFDDLNAIEKRTATRNLQKLHAETRDEGLKPMTASHINVHSGQVAKKDIPSKPKAANDDGATEEVA